MAQRKANSARHVWQTLAALVAAEQDPEKVLVLSKELIKALDADSKQQLDRVTFESKKRPISEKGHSRREMMAP